MAVYDVNGNNISDPIEKKVPWLSEMHRGYSSATVHENTLQAFYRAWLNGADGIEVDARLSSDGVYISCHDGTVTVDDVTYTISQETAETITSLVLSIDPVYGDCKIPTLASILKLCAFTGMIPYIDCKSITAESIAKLVIDSGLSGKAVYCNLSQANAQAILAIDANASFSVSYNANTIASWAEALGTEVTRRSAIWSYSLDTAKVEAIKSYGFKTLIANTNKTTYFQFMPDIVEFTSTSNCKKINQDYLDTIDFGVQLT